MRNVSLTAQFEKDIKRAKKPSCDMSRLSEVIRLLHRWRHATGIAHGRHGTARLGQGDLEDRQYRDHPLKGRYEGLRECHLSPDWLLIYHSSTEQVLMVRTGTHADLFR